MKERAARALFWRLEAPMKTSPAATLPGRVAFRERGLHVTELGRPQRK